MKLKRILLTTLLILIYQLSFAQWEENLQFDNFNVENGLSSHIVYSMVNDNNDFTWIITPNSVQRFDGAQFKNYTITKASGKSIHYYKNNSGLYLDKQNTLWTHNQFGVFKYDPKIDQFIEFKIKGLLNEKAFISIKEHDGYYYFISWQMLVRWNPKTNNFKKIFLKKRIADACDYGAQGLLIASPDGLQLIKDNEVKDFHLYGINLKGAGITTLYKGTDNSIWIGTYNKGIFLIKNNKIQHIKPDIDYKISSFTSYKNKILAGTDGYGIIVFDMDGHEDSNSSLKTLLGMPINKINIDQHQRFWVGSYGRGLFLHNPHKPYLRKINIHPDAYTAANHGYSSYRDSRKRLLLGTNKGLVIKDKNGKKRFLRPQHFIKKLSKNESFVINNIIEDRHHNFWVSSYGFGLFYLDGKNFKVLKSIKKFNIDGKEFSSKFIVQIELYGDKLWFKLIKGLVFEMDTKENSLKQIPIRSVSYIQYDEKHSCLLISNHDGIVMLKNDKITALVRMNNVSETDMVAIDENTFLLGSESQSLLIFDFNKKTVVPLDQGENNVLPSHVKQIIKNGFNEYIVIGDNGLFTFNYNNGKAEDIQEILVKFEAHQRASCLNNNSIILGSYDGFYQFPLNFKDAYSRNSQIIFDDLIVDDKIMVPSDEDDAILKDNINRTESIVLSPPHKGFSLNVVSPEYGNDALLYNWRLVGLEENFISKTSSQKISYQNLPYGTYTLEVQMFSSRKMKKLATRTLQVEVKPPFWNTTWAKVVYFIFVAFLLWMMYKSYYDYLQQKNLKARNAVFAEIAHELRTPLTLMQGPLQKLEQETNLDDAASRLLNMIRSNLDRLNKRITQLLDYERINQVNEELYVKEFDFLKMVQTLIRDYEPMLQKKKIHIGITTSLKELPVKLDFDKVEKIIYNLISNAIKYSKEGDNIKISLTHTGEHLNFSIEDHGIGIPKGNQKHIFKRFYRAENVMKNQKIGSGIGLVLSYKYTAMMNGKLYFESEENKQTTFFLELPIKVEGLMSDTVPSAISHYGEEFSEKEKQKYDYRIAVAEDNEELRNFIQSSLSDSFQIDTFENGKVCYDALLENDYDLVLSDVMMPEMNGYELCDKIKDNIETSHLPIILLTALNASMYKAEGYMHGADHYVIKPFDIRMLKYRIISLIENRKALSTFYQNKIQDGIVITKIHAKADSLDSKFLDELDGLIEKNLMNANYNVSEICKDIGMSRPVLYRKLKALTKLSPKEYIQAKRLTHAKKLLIETNESISTIAYESGYSDPKYFSTVFKKQFGMSPSDFLKLPKENTTAE
ncbi:hybrid sensor histidine kinase/response regulator transcription factor [Flammeovirga agarivorans]|uniref:histidine kinase n=1 Tax=Flammeovirga agarivorans TaxID=2726742 RepID=A0A7X8XV97_9BACT|nr:hybrid sensor histidine kinase/response regulator transcription factor [Flammeovirga agarivorans]NLR91113.1 helix-turn-helix domain-containing protein [Flammeovirga agarivorans]